tara:strand:- start:11220 stop:12353 length:1134 start_codon:yes stop_codon:yes gene_type:complete
MNWKFPYYNIDKGIDWEGIERDFDWFRDMADTPQDEIWHAEGNVQIHTKMVVEALLGLEEFQTLPEYFKNIMVAACLMHDIEKRSTTTTEKRNGRMCVVAPRHAQKGEKTTRNILYKDLNVPFGTREQICALVRYHGTPLWGIDRSNYHQTLAGASLRVSPALLALIARADVMGRDCPDKDELLFDIEIFEESCKGMDCYYSEAKFKSDLGRYYYLNKGGYIDYEPFDESKFTVFMLAGIAGSGKDTFIKKNYPELPMISLDEIRREMKIKPTDKKGNGRVIQEGKERCKVLMREHKDFVYNGTNITRDNRGKWISLFEEYGGKVVIEYIEVPYKTLISQNHNREYKVPENVINKMVNKLEIPFHEEAVSINYNVTI